MLSGIATAIKLSKPSVKVIGAEPELAADAQASLRSGKIVNVNGRANDPDSGGRTAHTEASVPSTLNTFDATWTTS